MQPVTMKLSNIHQLFCKHSNQTTISNYYGDMIYAVSTPRHLYRSLRRCNKCGKLIFSEMLDLSCPRSNMTLEDYINLLRKEDK